MKTLIFLLVGFFCYAHGQTAPKEDSTIQALTEKVNLVNQINKENEVLLKKKQEQISKKKSQQSEWRAKSKSSNYNEKVKTDITERPEGIKPDDNFKPEMEIPLQFYPDYIRGDLIYRLFHKNDYKVKIYTLINNEKVYLN